MSAHSKIGASSMSRWSKCPASVRLSENMPNTSSVYALEGTKAHELAEKILRGEKVDLSQYDEETVEAVMVYVDAFKKAAIDCTFYKVEQRFDLSAIYPGLYGTGDGLIYHEKTKVLQIWDYKHGQGIAVEVVNNQQLQYYALGALLASKVPCSEVKMVIAQPRAYHPDGPIRSWTIPVTDLLDFSADLIEAAQRTEDPNAPIVSGDHCRFCPAAPVCPELNEKAIETAKNEFSPTYYDPIKLADTLDKLPAIEAWIKAVREFAFREAETGKEIPNYKLVPKRATRKWKGSEEEIEKVLLMEFGLHYMEVKHEPELKSPAQIEKLIPKEMKARLEEIVSKESSGSTLVPSSDKRQSVKPSITTDFSVITATKE
jgi:hypothetical protein